MPHTKRKRHYRLGGSSEGMNFELRCCLCVLPKKSNNMPHVLITIGTSQTKKSYCRWKGFCITWLAGAPSQRVQKFILRPCLQNLFDTIFIQSFTDPYQKWKDPQNVVGVAEGHPHHILRAWPKAMPLSFLVGVCEALYKNLIMKS